MTNIGKVYSKKGEALREKVGSVLALRLAFLGRDTTVSPNSVERLRPWLGIDILA